MTRSLITPEPISRPTEVFLPPRKPKRAMCTFWSRDKKGRGQTTIGPAPYRVKPRTYLRPKQQLLSLPILRSLNTDSPSPLCASSKSGSSPAKRLGCCSLRISSSPSLQCSALTALHFSPEPLHI